MIDGGSGESQVFRTFWHGAPLNPYQLLCLRSFVARGHRVELFTYQDHLEVPEWIARKDAGAILPADKILHYQFGPQRGNPSLHSNLFRYVVLHRLGGWWVDMDVVLLRAELPPDPLFFAAEPVERTSAPADAATRFGTAVLKFPSQHPLLSEAIDRCLAIGEAAEWAQTGPHLLTELVVKHGLSRWAHSKHAAYPIPWRGIRAFFDPARCDEVRSQCSESTFVHLWHSMWRGFPDAAAPPEGSFLDWLASRLNFDLKFQGRMHFVGLPSEKPPANVPASASGRPSAGPASRRVLFAFAPPGDAWPSALLRGHQMMEMIGSASSSVECRAVALQDLWQLRGEQVVLTKSALLVSTRDSMARMRSLGHRLIADFVDMRVDADIAPLADVLLASSAGQDRFLRSRFPRIPTLHVTHHVDLRISAVATPTDQARIGYYGKLGNCLHLNAITDHVRIVDANDAADTRWMARLAESNAHYALRRPEEPGVFKPFLKGFLAAHCGVPVIIDAADEEARHYVGSDYPFVIGDLSLSSVRAHIGRFAGEYATSTWKSAVEIMRSVATRSNRGHVERELRALLNAIS